MAIKDTDRKARANYKKKITTIRMELYGTDEDIREHIEKLKEEGVSVQGYIKELIRADMNIKDMVRAELEKPNKKSEQVVRGEMLEVIGRAEREAALLRAKAMMKSHKKWKETHPRKKDENGDQ